MTFHLMFVHNTFSSAWVAKWPYFGKELPTRLAMCFHCILSILSIFSFSRFGFEGGVWILIGPVPVHCFLVTYTIEFSDISFFVSKVYLQLSPLYSWLPHSKSCYLCQQLFIHALHIRRYFEAHNPQNMSLSPIWSIPTSPSSFTIWQFGVVSLKLSLELYQVL